CTRLIIYIAIAAQIARIVKDDLVVVLYWRELRQMSRQEFAMVLDRWWSAEFLPVFLNRADAVRADCDDLLHLVFCEGRKILFRELLKQQIVAEPADRIARAFLFAQDAKCYAEKIHHTGQVGHDLTSFWIVAAHAAQPEAIFLSAIKTGELLPRNEFVAFARA